jgi:nucleotide-binding universal stress UspA family protein
MQQVDQDTIVVGIDGTPCSDRALTWALREARVTNRRLMLVHVWHWTLAAIESPMPLAGLPDPKTAGRRVLKAALDRARTTGIDTQTRLVEGAAPGPALSDAAAGAAMLVVGAHGRRDLARSLFGSVSKSCLQHARGPIVIIPPLYMAEPDANTREPAGAARQ